MNKHKETAYGKINLALDVLGKRADGYHLVRMIMQTVGICDTLTFEKTEEPGIVLDTGREDLSAGSDNLICRAAELMFCTYSLPGGLSVKLEKRIPIAAGMAGGSTDAAAVFRAVRTMYDLDVTDEKLQELALPLGADIPYCITGGTQLSEGIGEKLTRLPASPQCSLIVVKPDFSASTGWVYKTYDSLKEPEHPDIDAMLDAIRGQDLKGIADTCGNVLELVTGAEYPEIGRIERFLRAQGALQSIMTGSGPTVFAIFDDRDKAEKAFKALQEDGSFDRYSCFITDFVNKI